MATGTLSSKVFKPVPPMKGSFPLDHENLCRAEMIRYMKCLQDSNYNTENCREQVKNYLACRMDNNLMTKESWESLGLKEFEEGNKEISSVSDRKNILVGCTGSVAAIKLPVLVKRLLEIENVDIKVVTTEHGKHFIQKEGALENIDVLSDDDEWAAWQKRGDPVVHIDLSKWANIFLIAPLDANTLGKIAGGLCDNLLTCIVRAWNPSKPLLFCPAMNTKMWEHPVTSQHIEKLTSWGYIEVPVTAKVLICGDSGLGAMAEVDTIYETVCRFI